MRVDLGHVHGRFQIFHLGHLEYVGRDSKNRAKVS
jgi:nicotinamide mononucleotide adenylyltransferase